MSGRSCGTCRDRKINCDRRRPKCRNCTSRGRECQGYDMRLSWPKGNDPKRTLVALVSSRKPSNDRRARFVRASEFDMHLYHDLQACHFHRDKSTHHDGFKGPSKSFLSIIPLSWRPHDMGNGISHLFEYFSLVGFTSVGTFSVDPTSMRNLLMRMALSNNTPTSRAILYAMLAVSSLHRDGIQSQAVRYKIASISALAASTRDMSWGRSEAAAQVAASMLLSSSEIQMLSVSGNEWLSYLAGALNIVNIATLADSSDNIRNDDLSQLLAWVSYYDMLARFSIGIIGKRGLGNNSVSSYIKSWNQRPSAIIPSRQSINTNMPLHAVEWSPYAQMSLASGPYDKILGILSATMDTVMLSMGLAVTPPDASHLAERFDLLEDAASKIPPLATDDMLSPEPAISYVEQGEGGQHEHTRDRAAALLELYRLCALIYIARARETTLGQILNITHLHDRAFALLAAMPSCEKQFPIFVIGTEASTEEQRCIILDLLQRTEKDKMCRQQDCLRRGLEVVWVQRDLHTDQDLLLDYIELFRRICSSCENVPNLA
ncbi:fungal-specific transcription factor domain-containing protein [Fusarium flagelliforme]|uniref:fungal-specific transcription factor domain-containing protein n=1 Tax=Fusarium flagelliforme TaxID=2675880 RepID=UPI001E8EA584|nr:fungal-specific transcription factor domain-containing protein [Fusarium flagelliforme]KAH7175023.1 fungal-specific transcription factor domain-containing protein [Fusarium flagelliforme]